MYYTDIHYIRLENTKCYRYYTDIHYIRRENTKCYVLYRYILYKTREYKVSGIIQIYTLYTTRENKNGKENTYTRSDTHTEEKPYRGTKLMAVFVLIICFLSVYIQTNIVRRAE